ncbi:DUF134 domain-containing protein [Candidatus Gracilibacteria bacterium]|nr:DUF134 domain-containing protein [Candidatus Gracilibacteria bacterium]
MPRPKSKREITQSPEITYYKPRGVPVRELQIMRLTLEEWEALRLKNVEGFSQIQSAKKMKTSQSTFQRILTNAEKKLCTGIIKGMAIEISLHP